MELADFLIHGANVLYLFSYLVRDIFWLRLLTVVAIATLMVYFVLQGLWVAFGWNTVFLAINLVQIVILWLERRPVQLSPREERLRELVFAALSPRELQRLVAVGQWQTSAPGAELVAEGAAVDQLRVIFEGEATVSCEGAAVATLGEGHFIGEMSYLTGEPPSATVAAASETTCLSWQREALEAWLDQHPGVRSTLQKIVGTDLAAKLRRAAR